MSFIPQNTLQQDLFLVAKGQYQSNRGLHRSEIARQVCAAHILHDIDRMDLHSTLHWVTREFITHGVILTKPQDVTRFILELGTNSPITSAMIPAEIKEHYNPRMSYLFLAIEELLNIVRYLRMADSAGNWLLPFERPELDQALEQLLTDYNTKKQDTGHV